MFSISFVYERDELLFSCNYNKQTLSYALSFRAGTRIILREKNDNIFNSTLGKRLIVGPKFVPTLFSLFRHNLMAHRVLFLLIKIYISPRFQELATLTIYSRVYRLSGLFTILYPFYRYISTEKPR